jgi:hypothetical protein
MELKSVADGPGCIDIQLELPARSFRASDAG